MSKTEELEKVSSSIKSYMAYYSDTADTMEYIIENYEKALKILSRGTKNEEIISDLIYQCKVYMHQNYDVEIDRRVYENEFERYFWEGILSPKSYKRENTVGKNGVLYYEQQSKKDGKILKLKIENSVLYKFVEFGKRWVRIDPKLYNYK